MISTSWSMSRISRLIVFVPASFLLTMVQSPMAAQIASPSNAGGNAGNNATGSSTSPLSTPSFSPSTSLTPIVPSISVDVNGGITSSPQVISTVLSAVAVSATGVDSILSPVAMGTPSSFSSINGATAINILVASPSGAVRQAGTINQLQQEVSPLLVDRETIIITSNNTGNSGSITPQQSNLIVSLSGGAPQQSSLVVSLSGVEVELATTPTNQANIAQFAAIAIVVGMSPASLTAGASLVATGASPVQVAQLMSALQGMAKASSLTPLSNGIDAYNSMIINSTDGMLQSLLNQDVFQAAGRTLRAARAAIGS